jgi:hypothetical protein
MAPQSRRARPRAEGSPGPLAAARVARPPQRADALAHACTHTRAGGCGPGGPGRRSLSVARPSGPRQSGPSGGTSEKAAWASSAASSPAPSTSASETGPSGDTAAARRQAPAGRAGNGTLASPAAATFTEGASSKSRRSPGAQRAPRASSRAAGWAGSSAPQQPSRSRVGGRAEGAVGGGASALADGGGRAGPPATASGGGALRPHDASAASKTTLRTLVSPGLARPAPRRPRGLRRARLASGPPRRARPSGPCGTSPRTAPPCRA